MDTLLSTRYNNPYVQIPPDFHTRIMKKVGYSVAHRRILWALVMLIALVVPINFILVSGRVDGPFVSVLHLHALFEYASLQSFGMIFALFIISTVGAGVLFSMLKNKYCNRKAYQFSQKAVLPNIFVARLLSIVLLVCIIELISISTCIGVLSITASAHANPFVSMQAFEQVVQAELREHIFAY